METFDGYPYPIQRADAIRYFVLHHFGGIYIDLDDVRSRLTLMRNRSLTRKTGVQPQSGPTPRLPSMGPPYNAYRYLE